MIAITHYLRLLFITILNVYLAEHLYIKQLCHIIYVSVIIHTETFSYVCENITV